MIKEKKPTVERPDDPALFFYIGLTTLRDESNMYQYSDEFDNDERSVSVHFWAYGWFISIHCRAPYKDCVTIKCWWWWWRLWYNEYRLHADDYSSKNSVTDRYGGVLQLCTPLVVCRLRLPYCLTIIGCNFVSDDLLNKTLISYNGPWFTFPFMYIWWHHNDIIRF